MIHNGINVLDIRKGYYVNFLKELIHNKKAKKKYVDGFIAEKENKKDFYNEELTLLYGKKFANIVVENLKTQDIQKNFYRLYKEMKKSVHHNDMIIKVGVQINNLYRIFKKKPGYFIVILGTDGSGKSTIINAITPILNETFHNSVIYEHFRPNLLPDIGVLLNKRDKSELPVTDPHKQKQSKILTSIIRWGYYMIDYIFGYMIKIFPVIHSKSKIFIFDRYYYDYYIDQKRSRINLPLWVIHLGEFCIAKPDIILCLGGNPEIIYNRKPETNLQEVSKQMDRLKQFCENRKNVVWIDTDTPVEESVSQTMTAIYNTLNKRFKFVLK
jgi:thymidylate kinase